MKRLGGKLGLPKNTIVPTVFLKDQDLKPLRKWQQQIGTSIHIWQVFFDLAFGISLDTAEELISSGKIEPREQTYQAPGGAVTRKTTYRVYYHYAYAVGEAQEEPNLAADYIVSPIVSPSGHILPYVRFEGGQLTIGPEALQVLDKLSSGGEGATQG